jgi:hypothetical protein
MVPEEINKDLQEIIDVTSNIVKTLIDRLKDGWQALPDLMAMFPPLMGIQMAVEGNANAWAWLFPLTDEKVDIVVDAVMAKLGETSPLLRSFVKHVLLIIAHGYMAVAEAKELFAPKTENPS